MSSLKTIASTLAISVLLCTNIYAQESSFEEVRLKNKIVPLTSSVYKLLEYHEVAGHTRILPLAKPYSKIFILKTLKSIADNDRVTERERDIVNRYISDLSRESNGIQLASGSAKNTYGLIGLGTGAEVRSGVGENSARTLVFSAEPYLAGDIGKNLTFHASLGPSIEKLAPDLFYGSYTKDKQVRFPHEEVGFSYLPYKFSFESMNIRTTVESKIPGYSEITEKIAVGFLYSTELNTSWFDGALQMGINNQRRAWGNDYDNLTLSASARKFPAFEFKLAPLKWLRYSYLLGSLHSGKSLFGAYKSEIYGYDVGALQNNFTLHMLEVEPWDWFLITATAGNVWVKRFEINYMIPFVFSHLSELESGDYDNLTMSLDFTFKVPNFGKIWFSFFNDEFSFIEKGNLLKMPRNRYAWQLGFVNKMSFLPQTLSSFKYSRVTPFAYTHYPETRLSNFNNRPYDMTYSNDGFNLGFYLPPNSGEFNWTLTSFAVNNLTLTMENRFIMHGTNDLASEEVKLIFGDLYRHQYTNPGEDIHQYPLLDFTKDGIYDFTLSSEIRFDYRIRKSPYLDYYRLFGTIGAARTWWKENSSGVTAPAPRNFATISFGVAIDI
jgi:hypothetical protein